MKATDTINIPMTALEGLMLRVLLGQVSGVLDFYGVLRDDIGLPLGGLRGTPIDVFKWNEGSELHTWALAQFNDPKQEAIDRLEKTINDAASELAKLKAGDE
jgi:hypothetical protein